MKIFQTIKGYISKIEVRSILKPMLAMAILSFVYNYAYMCLSLYRYMINDTIFGIIQYGLSLISGLGFYWIATYVWIQKMQKISLRQAIYVLLWQAVCILIVSGGLGYLHQIAMNNTGLLIVSQLLSAIVLIFMIPLQLLFYYTLFLNKKGKEIFSYMKGVFFAKQKTILNWFCALLIFIIVIDTFTNGAFSILYGFDAYSMVNSMMYLGNPMVMWMMTVVLALQAVGTATTVMMAFSFFLIGVVYSIFELNFIRFIQRKCYEYESK